jgi:hypothetical protein
LYTPGIPKLEVSWHYLTKEKKLSLTVKQLQKNLFAFPLELRLDNVENSVAKTVRVSKQQETFILPVKQKPGEIKLDPLTSLLFTGSITEKK